MKFSVLHRNHCAKSPEYTETPDGHSFRLMSLHYFLAAQIEEYLWWLPEVSPLPTSVQNPEHTVFSYEEDVMRIMTYTNARNNLRQLIDDVVDSSEETVVTSKDGRDVVVMSLADYNGWTTTNRLLSTPENTSRLLKAVEDIKAGKVIERDLIDE
jgi:antitoxin YefM